jgi:hypothetical protein
MTMNTERRNFIAAIGATAASTAVLAGTQALAQGAQQTEAKAIPCLHDPRLQIAERALAEAQEAGEIVVCPRFPLPSGSRPTRRPRSPADGRRFIPPCR